MFPVSVPSSIAGLPRFSVIFSSSLVCLGRAGIGHPLASAVSTDRTAGACWSLLDCSKFWRCFRLLHGAVAGLENEAC